MLPKLKHISQPISTRSTASMVNLHQNPVQCPPDTTQSRQLKATQS